MVYSDFGSERLGRHIICVCRIRSTFEYFVILLVFALSIQMQPY